MVYYGLRCIMCYSFIPRKQFKIEERSYCFNCYMKEKFRMCWYALQKSFIYRGNCSIIYTSELAIWFIPYWFANTHEGRTILFKQWIMDFLFFWSIPSWISYIMVHKYVSICMYLDNCVLQSIQSENMRSSDFIFIRDNLRRMHCKYCRATFQKIEIAERHERNCNSKWRF